MNTAMTISIYIIGVMLAFFMMRKGHLSEENKNVSRFDILMMIVIILLSWIGVLFMVFIDSQLFLGSIYKKWNNFWNKQIRL
jgi:hypothetical protein